MQPNAVKMRSGRPNISMRARGSGFTLIELLVALTIFAVISALSLRAVSSALDHRSHIEEEGQKWRDLGRLFAMIESDLGAMLSTAGLAMQGAPDAVADDSVWLAFARAGSGEDHESALAPLGVEYRLVSGYIERATYQDLVNPGSGAALSVQRFLPKLDGLRLRYLNAHQQWAASWGESAGSIPRAIQAQFTLEGGALIQRVFMIR